MDRRLRLLALLLVVIVFPIAYAAAIDVGLSHQTIEYQAAWVDPQFQSGWFFSSTRGLHGSIATENEVLSVTSYSVVTPQDFVAAELTQMPAVNLSQNPFIIVSVKTPTVYVAVRIAVQTMNGEWAVLLAKTYADTTWHTEVIDLRFFGLTGPAAIQGLQLGWIGVEHSAPPGTVVMFQNLELARLAGGN